MSSSRIFADDTRLPVLDPGRGRTKTGRLWGYAIDDRPWKGSTPPAAVYLYAEDRKGEHPAAHLAEFQGVLQVDGYAGFKSLLAGRPPDQIKLAFCWAHCRRGFYELYRSTGSPLAEEALRRIGELYRIEAEIRGRPAEERRTVRQERSKPLVEALHAWLTIQLGRVSGRSTLAEAIRYALRHWPGLVLSPWPGSPTCLSASSRAAPRPTSLSSSCPGLGRVSSSQPPSMLQRHDGQTTFARQITPTKEASVAIDKRVPVTTSDARTTLRPGEHQWQLVLSIAAGAGFVALLIYTSTSNSIKTGLVTFSISFLLAGSCLFIGALLGFLFAIPRYIQEQRADALERPATADQADRAARVRYGANTNLEQISDWLTKILVGVGLAQFSQFKNSLVDAANFFGPSLNDSTFGKYLALSLITFFSVVGFLFGYLWTRLLLAGQLARADLEAIVERVDQIAKSQEEQPQIDAAALSLVARQLNLSGGDLPVKANELVDSIRKASAPVKVTVFNQTRSARKAAETQDKGAIERTIPIFEALIVSDVEGQFHRNHAQLAYAHMEKVNPDLTKAEQELTTAINMRGSWQYNNFTIYELNRAICRIRLDKNFAAHQVSDADNKQRILSDLRVAYLSDPTLSNVETISEWKRVNDVTEADLRS
jgi:hypothetical protein